MTLRQSRQTKGENIRFTYTDGNMYKNAIPLMRKYVIHESGYMYIFVYTTRTREDCFEMLHSNYAPKCDHKSFGRFFVEFFC